MHLEITSLLTTEPIKDMMQNDLRLRPSRQNKELFTKVIEAIVWIFGSYTCRPTKTIQYNCDLILPSVQSSEVHKRRYRRYKLL